MPPATVLVGIRVLVLLLVVVLSESCRCSPTLERDEHDAELVRWAARNGVQASGVAFPAYFAGGVRGIVATRDLAGNGQVVLRVPFRSIIAVGGPRPEPQELKRDLDALRRKDDAFVQLVVRLAWELTHAERSPWYSYLQSLPFDPVRAGDWSESEVWELHNARFARSLVRHWKGKWLADWRLLSGDRSGRHRRGWLARDVFKWAHDMVWTRSFSVDDAFEFCIVPIADLFNHKAGALFNWRAQFYQGELHFEVFHNAPGLVVRAGEQVFLNYGGRPDCCSDAHLLASYGFVDANNTGNFVRLDFPQSVTHRVARVAAWNSIVARHRVRGKCLNAAGGARACHGGQTVATLPLRRRRQSQRESPHVHWLLAHCRVAFCERDNVRECHKPVHVAEEVTMLKRCVNQQFRSVLDGMPTTLEEDRRQQQAAPSSPAAAAALVYRIARKEILQFHWLDLRDRVLPLVECTSVRGMRTIWFHRLVNNN